MDKIKYVKDHSTQEVFYPIVKSEGIVDAWNIVDEDIYNLFYPRVEGIAFQAEEMKLKPFQEKILKYTFTPSDAYDQKVTFTISNPDVVGVQKTPKTAIGFLPGTTDVIISTVDGGYTSQMSVTVSDPSNKQILYKGSNHSEELMSDEEVTATYNKKYGIATYPDTVTSLASGILSNDSRLSMLYLPSTITQINSNALSNIPKLTSLVLPTSLTYVGDHALSETGLTQIQLPKSLQTVGNYAFSYGSLSDIFIYASLTSIGEGAFTGHPYDTIVVDPNNPVYDSRNNCNAIIETSTNILKVGSKNTIIPEDVISIAPHAFTKSELESISIPASVETISLDAFEECTMFKEYLVHSDNSMYSSIDGVLYNKDQSILLSIPNKVTSINVPDTCLTIQGTAAGNTSLTTFNTGNGVESIPTEMFNGCTNLAEITLGENVSDVSDLFDYVVPEVVNLNAVNVSVSTQDVIGIQNLNIGPNVESIPNDLIRIQSIVVDENNTTFDSRNNCNAAIRIETNELVKGSNSAFIPDGVLSIGYYAFTGCTMETIAIPSTVTYIDSYAFSLMSKLTSIVIPESVTEIAHNAFSFSTKLADVVLPSSLTTIGDRAFEMTSIRSIIIPEEISSLGQQVFPDSLQEVTWNAKSCSGQSKIFDNQALKLFTFGNQVSHIPGNLLYQQTSLSEITVPQSVVTCGDNWMSQSSVKILHWNAIDCQSCNHGAVGLTELIFSNQVEAIPAYIGYGCSDLTNVIIPESATSIGDYAFANTGITELIIPTSVQSIGQAALPSQLEKLVLNSTVPPTLGIDNYKATVTEVIVPTEAVDVYKVTEGWSDFAAVITDGYIPTECTSLTIEAVDVDAEQTTTTITYTAMTNGTNYYGDVVKENVEITGSAESDPFEANFSETDPATRTITFSYLGMTAETTITQSVYTPEKFTVVLNNEWAISSITAPEIPEEDDIVIHDGILYESLNSGQDNSTAVMYIDVENVSQFGLGVRSDSESDYDYVIVSQPDAEIDANTDITDSNLVAFTTKGQSNSSTRIYGYQNVDFTGLTQDKHRVTVMYKKDSITSEGADKGYVFIYK